MDLQQKVRQTLNILKEHIPDARTELKYETPFQLMVAVILSAQCTDKRVNEVTPELFRSFPDAQSMANATFEAVFPLIQSISYPNQKTQYLLQASRILVEKFGGNIPNTLSELLTLPGVGRKTANVLLSVLYRQPAMAVDTHVQRVVNRLGWVQTKTPAQTEKLLLQLIDPELIPDAHHLLILHGRYTCKAHKPLCAQCPIRDYCHTYTSKNGEYEV